MNRGETTGCADSRRREHSAVGGCRIQYGEDGDPGEPIARQRAHRLGVRGQRLSAVGHRQRPAVVGNGMCQTRSSAAMAMVSESARQSSPSVLWRSPRRSGTGQSWKPCVSAAAISRRGSRAAPGVQSGPAPPQSFFILSGNIDVSRPGKTVNHSDEAARGIERSRRASWLLRAVKYCGRAEAVRRTSRRSAEILPSEHARFGPRGR